MAEDQAGIRVSNIVVGATMGTVLLISLYAMLDPFWGTVATAYLIYEAYTLLNKHPDDTLSESVWRLATHPIVPLLAGIGLGWSMNVFHLSTEAWVAIGILYGHFFFQRSN